jgi:thioredoxin-related protein
MPRVHRLPGVFVLSVGLVSLAATPAGAQQIQWRLDYNKARQEAKERNLPLLMDVGTNNCFYCKQLDATTFHDPAVMRLINDRFIPLRMDGAKYKSLTDALQIKGFPALVFATPQGKVVAIHEGYLEPPAFYGWTQQVLAMLYPPAGAASLGGPLQLTAAQKPGSAVLDRTAQARTLLALAEEDFRTQQYVCCLMRCKLLDANFADLPEAGMARQLAQQLKSDPERIQLTSAQLTQSLCELYLDLSKSLIDSGQRQQAATYLQWIMQACPHTPQAEAAEQLLNPPATAAPKGPNLPGRPSS